MNLFIQPDTRSASRQNADPLDNLLRDFYQSEMPHPWPMPPLRVTAPAASSSWSLSRSRLALAASVALLLIGSWWLSGRAPDYSAPVLGIHDHQGSGAADVGARGKITGKVKEQETRKDAELPAHR